MIEEPGINITQFVNLLRCHSLLEGIADVENPLFIGNRKFGLDRILGGLFGSSPEILLTATQSEVTNFQASQRFLQRLFESTADGHGFADGFHLHGQNRVGIREFFECPAGNFGDDVVDGWFKTGKRFAGDVVSDFIESITDGQLRGDFCNRESGRFGSQGTGATDAGIHFDDRHAARIGIDGELNVRATGFDADLTHTGDSGIAHPLVFFIGECLCRRDGDGITGVDAHRIEVFDSADDDHVVGLIAHDFHLVFFPAENGFFQQDFIDGREGQTAADFLYKLFAVVSHAATCSPEGIAGANNDRQSDVLHCRIGFLHVVYDSTAGTVEPDFGHRFFKLVTAFCFGDDRFFGTDEFHAQLVKDAATGKIHRSVQAGLTAERRQQGIGFFDLDDFLNILPGDRFDISPMCCFRIGHNRSRIGVYQHDFITIFPQCLTGLGSRIVKFTRLTDHNRTGAND